MVRVLKPSGSIFVNLGDKYSTGNSGDSGMAKLGEQYRGGGHTEAKAKTRSAAVAGFRPKSLLGIPWRYAIRCIDQLGLILRAEIIWSKPNGLPESVTDRVRRSHEQWFHFTVQPRYFAAVDEIREPHSDKNLPDGPRGRAGVNLPTFIPPERDGVARKAYRRDHNEYNPLGKLPGSVWTVPTQPLEVPPELGVDHFAAYPMEWPRRIIQGWTPNGICVACGEGRRPVADRTPMLWRPGIGLTAGYNAPGATRVATSGTMLAPAETRITGYVCGCPEPTAPTRPAVVLDPFMGTGTTLVVARALGRNSIGVDLSADYCRLAQWRINNPQQLAAALQVEKPDVIPAGQLSLFEDGMT